MNDDSIGICMMNSMIKENGVTFKQLEKNIYAWVCQIGREFTKEFLERYDWMLLEDGEPEPSKMYVKTTN